MNMMIMKMAPHTTPCASGLKQILQYNKNDICGLSLQQMQQIHYLYYKIYTLKEALDHA